ncbi:MAG: type 2 isopentenyl-diphosphate Delta-isomerase [Myxococcales bacterium]|nr:type 2 isopentenyl-diphosphate Delta-isomerase [Myxococcales bacterium]|tara:strand:+ start:93 stop:1157 length:1065 start_codon:yes stop_codon:yes gene_type:complete
MTDRHQRKLDHIAHCADDRAVFKSHQGLFDDVTLVHNALPEMAMHEIDLTTPLIKSTLAAPLMVTGMTGGPDKAGEINRGIARVCENLGLAFGVGSQRLLTDTPDAVRTYSVRDIAPNLVLFGNLGVNQARDLGPAKVSELMKSIGADYIAIHLNAAMELCQPGADADSDFRGGFDTIGRLVDALDGHVLVKECGCGIGPDQFRRLVELGVPAIDVSGSGGTSWVKVEALRATGQLAELGETFAEWGIPTLAATALASRIGGAQIISSGGVDSGLKAAKALALGASIAGTARPVLQAFLSGGESGATAFLETLVAGLRTAMALTGCRRPNELAERHKLMGPRLQQWLTLDETGP